MNDLFCVISYVVPKEIRDSLRIIFGDVIELPPDHALPPAVRHHPDMIFALCDGHLFFSGEYLATYPTLVHRIAELGGWNVTTTDMPRGETYPLDVGFNVAITNDSMGNPCLLGHRSAVCPELLAHAEKSGIRFIPVCQGYTGCSCLCTDDAVLTFDAGLKKELQKNNIPCLRLSGGGISLPGYNEGFLGGAGGFYDKTIYLFGNANKLPCARELNEFARQHAYKIHSLSAGSAVDYGGLKIYKRKGTHHV